MIIAEMQHSIRAKFFDFIGACFCVIALLVSPAYAVQNHHADQGTLGIEKPRSVPTKMIKIKQNFVQQNLPVPQVTGSVEKLIQSEDEALISAIISQDLKRQKGQ